MIESTMQAARLEVARLLRHGTADAAKADLDMAATSNVAEEPERTELLEFVRSEGLRKALDFRDRRYGALKVY